jgi:cytoskeletal protein CcmA (bactofilin family)
MSVFRRDRDSNRMTTSAPPPVQQPVVPQSPSYEPEVIPQVQPLPISSSARPEAPHTALPALQRDNAAVIDKNSQLTGTLHSEGNVLIEGVFEGEIEAKETILIARDAKTNAKLRANDVIISGMFDGVIDCRHRVQIMSTSTLRGEVNTPILVVEEGSTVDCCFKMTRGGE